MLRPFPPQSHYKIFAGRLDKATNETKTIDMYNIYVIQDSVDCHYESGYIAQPVKTWTGSSKALPSTIGWPVGTKTQYARRLFEGQKFPPSIDEIKGTTLVKDDPDYITPPHMIVEYKAKNKSAYESKVQSTYNGAAMIFSRNEAFTYINKPEPPRQPAMLSATVVGPSWEVFGHYTHRQ